MPSIKPLKCPNCGKRAAWKLILVPDPHLLDEQPPGTKCFQCANCSCVLRRHKKPSN